MRYLLTSLLCVLTVTLTAQITITSSDLPQAGESYTIQTSLPDPSSDFTTTGVGFDWDFSNLISDSAAEVEFGAMEDAPVLAQLTFNNEWVNPEYLCDVLGPGELDFAALETLGVELPVAISNLYSYIQTSNDSYNIAGISMNIEGIDLPVEYSDIDEIHPLPLNYMDEINSTSAFTVNIPEVFTYETSASRVGSVDGWGTLTLPGGATHEVLRVNTTITTHDIFSLSGSDPFEIDRVSTVYSWVGDGGMPYLEVSMVFGATFSVEYQGDDSCVDIDEDGVCDIFEGLGCTDPNASSYDPNATEDDGSCLYTGCMDSNSCNFNPDATEDDGNCDYSCCPGPGCCDDGTYWNVDTQTCLLDITFCSWQPDSNADGNIGIGDLLDLLSVFGDTDYDEDGVFDSVDDCVDTAACNYQANPSEPCAYIDVLGVCGGGCEADEDDDSICDDIDDCIGVIDECGVCNGPGPTEVVIESITILYDSLYAEQINEWWVFEIGADTVFNYTCIPDFILITDDNIHDAVDLWLSEEASAEATYGHISDWDVSSVTNMFQMFDYSNFNSDISSWDVSSVTNMYDMFANTTSFNSDISSWDVSSVADMNYMFFNAASFNSDISSWDVSSVTNMYMFEGESALSEENRCLIHTTFSSNTAWPYDWSEFCPAVFNSCGDDIGHEGYDYSTVQIGEQCWFSENCRYLPEVSPSNEGNSTDPYYYVYDYEGTDVASAISTSNYETYGVLYNWPAAMESGTCPSGWHIPSDDEFTQLTDFLGGVSVAGAAMKSSSGWTDNGNGTNSSGLNVLPIGYRSSNGSYSYINDYGYLWSSSAAAAAGAVYRELSYIDSVVSSIGNTREHGVSARCIKD